MLINTIILVLLTLKWGHSVLNAYCGVSVAPRSLCKSQLKLAQISPLWVFSPLNPDYCTVTALATAASTRDTR
ncbi:hypothetical protein PR001_g26248 [Phytophthora rubi]|uniref:Secreted protein n=1 Tax=Phytophthora rubi TaxID=129364 RepID=A0A6A3I0F6_9STRA|nr:hypothetical protein PR001_g26248 [Phytophthora rubi]